MKIEKALMLQPLRIYKRWPLPDDFTGMVLGSPTLAFGQLAAVLKPIKSYYMDGAVRDYTLAELTRRACEADIVMINAHSSIGSLNAEANLRHILETCPNKPIVMGGHHATVYDFEWLGRGAHFIVRNEGEETIKELVTAIENGGPYDKIKGLSWRDNNHEFHRNPARPLIKNLDDVPIPDWSIYNPKYYNLPFTHPGFAITAETSRGCPFKCRFCAASKMWMHKQRFKSPERVLEELRILKSMGYANLWFADDNFGANPEIYSRIYEGMIRENMDFNFMVFIRPDTIAKYPDLTALAYKAGLRVALIGLESPVNRILKDYTKGTDIDLLNKTVEVAHKNKIFIGGFFIVGYLGEKQEETDATFRAAEKMADYPIISIFEPRYGTYDFERSVKINDIPGGDMFYHNTVKFIPSKTHILKQYRAFYRRYLVHPKQLYKLLFGTPTQKKWYRNLYSNMAKSIISVSPAKVANPWKMVKIITR